VIIDAFILFDELDMLEFRLKYLRDHVDKFVIIENSHTFTGKKKPFNYLENQHRFAWAKDKIIYYQSYIDQGEPWATETAQRERILSATDGFAANDILVISDIDEIPNYNMITLAQASPCFMPFACQQAFFYYNLKTLRNEIWKGSIFCYLGWARLSTIAFLRANRNIWPSIRGGGWHLSYFGGIEKIQKKIRAFSHQEYNKPPFTDADHIGSCIDTGGDLFNRGIRSVMPPENFFPREFEECAKHYKWGLE
jgi:beta-1,4-mannosyl-glycoprotein beta-1,4-N-acetylglucosaminyltransferase